MAKEVIRHCGIAVSVSLNLSPRTNICVAIDAMHIVNTIVLKPAWVTTGDDLAREFATRVDDRSKMHLQWVFYLIDIVKYR